MLYYVPRFSPKLQKQKALLSVLSIAWELLPRFVLLLLEAKCTLFGGLLLPTAAQLIARASSVFSTTTKAEGTAVAAAALQCGAMRCNDLLQMIPRVFPQLQKQATLQLIAWKICPVLFYNDRSRRHGCCCCCGAMRCNVLPRMIPQVFLQLQEEKELPLLLCMRRNCLIVQNKYPAFFSTAP